jgi:hypothetical protein
VAVSLQLLFFLAQAADDFIKHGPTRFLRGDCFKFGALADADLDLVVDVAGKNGRVQAAEVVAQRVHGATLLLFVVGASRAFFLELQSS